MNKFKEYWNKIDWGYTLLCVLAAPFVLFFAFMLVASTTPDLLERWFK